MSRLHAAVIGSPISHSLSPGIFSFLANRLERTDFEYRAEKVESEDLFRILQRSKEEANFVGLNVTLPHKEQILSHLDEITHEARAIGAVNVVQNKSGKLIGHNTDTHGIQMTLEQSGFQVKGTAAFIFGSGGAARAVASILGMHGAREVIFFNPNSHRTENLIQKFAPEFPNTCFRSISSPSKDRPRDLPTIDLWINATPLGMSGNSKSRSGESASQFFRSVTQKLEIQFSKKAYAFDLIYHPEYTPFLALAEERGLTLLGGLNMLVEQALETWRIWFGQEPRLPLLKLELADYLKNRPLFLCGFMGAGKSTLGDLLAKKLNWKFLDIDFLIEQELGMTIPAIFNLKGEAYLRAIESKIIQRHAFSSRTIIALGGGSLNQKDTVETIKKAGQLIYLSATPKTLMRRLTQEPGQRPLFHALSSRENPEIEIATLLALRESNYQESQYRIDTDDLSPEEIVAELIQKIGR